MSSGQISRYLPNDQYQASINANSPSALNPFATLNDIVNIYNSDGTIPNGVTRTATLNTGASLIFSTGSGNVFTLDNVGNFTLGLNAITTLAGISIGNTASSTNDIAIGSNAVSSGSSVVIGMTATGISTRNVIIGGGASTSNGDSVVVGASASSTAGRTVALGYNTTAATTNSIAIGYTTQATGNNAIAIGSTVTATGTNSLSLGYNSDATATNSTALGPAAQAQGINNISIGSNSLADGTTNSFAIGFRAQASGLRTFALGVSQNNANFMQNSVNDSFGIGFGTINPNILLAKSTDSYINSSGRLFFGDGSVIPAEGAPNNIPANYEKLAVLGNVEAMGSGNGFVAQADDGNRVLMKLVNISPGVYAWDAGTVLP